MPDDPPDSPDNASGLQCGEPQSSGETHAAEENRPPDKTQPSADTQPSGEPRPTEEKQATEEGRPREGRPRKRGWMDWRPGPASDPRFNRPTRPPHGGPHRPPGPPDLPPLDEPPDAHGNIGPPDPGGPHFRPVHPPHPPGGPHSRQTAPHHRSTPPRSRAKPAEAAPTTAPDTETDPTATADEPAAANPAQPVQERAFREAWRNRSSDVTETADEPRKPRRRQRGPGRVEGLVAAAVVLFSGGVYGLYSLAQSMQGNETPQNSDTASTAATDATDQDTDQETAQTATEPSEPEADPRLQPQNIRDRFCRANGGAENLESMSTLLQKGQIEMGETTYPYIQYKKQPDQSYMKLDAGGFDIIFGVRDDTAWRIVRVPGKTERDARLVPESENKELLRTAQFYSDFTRHCLNLGGRILEAQWGESSNGDPALRVTFDPENGQPVKTLLLHPEFYYVMESRFISEAKETVEIANTDYRTVSDIWVPFRSETLVDGEQTASMTVSETRFNVGVVPVLFDVPEDIKPASADANP